MKKYILNIKSHCEAPDIEDEITADELVDEAGVDSFDCAKKYYSDMYKNDDIEIEKEHIDTVYQCDECGSYLSKTEHNDQDKLCYDCLDTLHGR